MTPRSVSSVSFLPPVVLVSWRPALPWRTGCRRVACLVGTVCLLGASSLWTGCARPVHQAPAPSAASTEAASTEAASPPFAPGALTRALHRAVNRTRARHGRPPLRWSDSLAHLARQHSRDMARRGFFGHTNPEGEMPARRAQRLGFPAAKRLASGRRVGIGENLFRTYRYDGYRDVYRRRGHAPRRHVRRVYDWKSTQALARETVQAWLDSPPHRRALLSPRFDRHGLAAAAADHQVYVTQNLF